MSRDNNYPREESVMSGPSINLPQLPRCEQTVAVLAVSSLPETLTRLRAIFQHTNWVIHEASCCESALRFLTRNPVAVVVCERRLSDGCWKDLLDRANTLQTPPLVIVTGYDADESLWAEVLNLGGYDVLARPFERSEVTRIISLAWLHWKEGRKAVGQEVAVTATGKAFAAAASA